MKNCDEGLGFNLQGAKQSVVDGLQRPFGRRGCPAGAGFAFLPMVAMMLALFQGTPWAQAQSTPPVSNLGSPAFANPSEIDDRPAEKRLRGVIELIDGTYNIPNAQNNQTMRQFRGWDPARPMPDFPNVLAPGPTLRARLGDLIEISFLNKVDDSKFSYTFDTNSKPGFSGFGCDAETTTDATTGKTIAYYPSEDKFPNCFHGSSTANLHFHGTHTDPDGLGDNVLVQVLPQVKQPDWTATFNKIYDSGKIPQTWSEMPENYKTKQLQMIKEYDMTAAAEAKKNGLPPPGSLFDADMQAINAGQWPQYLMGAFPNFFQLPDYSSGDFGAGQSPGTHWYHAHKHGSTSLQSVNGMAGTFVIESTQEGGYDQVIRKFYGWGDSYGTHEKIIFLQEFDTTPNALRPGPNGTEQMVVNGLPTPTIPMQPGEVQLWRVVNGTVGDTFQPNISALVASGFAMKQTAQDGVQFSPANYNSQPVLSGQVPGGTILSTGNRADLLVQAPSKPGVYAVQNSGTTVFYVQVAGSPAVLPNGPFPTVWAEMPKFLLDLPKPGPYDIKNPGSPVKFQQWANNDPVNGLPHFMINNKQFEETGPIVDQCMPLNGLQDWVLENYTQSAAHPFHIHVNPFQVTEIDTPTGQDTYSKYTPTSDYIWQDVIAIPEANVTKEGVVTPGRIIIRQRYPDFIGTFVLHCHILPHEDRGMMQLVRIVPAQLYPNACQGNIPHHH